MWKNTKYGVFTGIVALSSISLLACTANSGLHPYAKTNQLQGQRQGVMHQNQPFSGRYGAGVPQLRPASSLHRPVQARYQPLSGRYGRYGQTAGAALPPPGPGDMFQRWVDYEPQYLLYPGDQIDVVVPSAPELSRTLTVAPDGRINMPMVEPIMAAGRSIPAVKQALQAELAKQLRDPKVSLTARAFAPQNIYVGGQVTQQGTYALTGPIGSLEAIIMAGGFLPSAKTGKVVILRRAPNGGLMMRVVNHKRGLKNVRGYADNMQLRRGDIVFVPRNSLSEVGVFVQQLRNAIPVDVGVSYNLGNNFSSSTP